MRTLFLSLLSFVFLVACQTPDVSPTAAAVEDVSPAVAAERVSGKNTVLVDVREPEEWEETGVAAPAYLLSLSDLQGNRDQWDAFLSENGNREILLYCRSGNRSGIAADILAEEGYDVGNIGRFRDWQAANLPEREFDEPRR